MALSANTVLEVRQAGADTNGGGFVTGASGTDWSQQNAAQYAVTDGVTAGSTTITSATANFGADVVGNLIYIAGGTGSVTAGWYQITARGSATSITVDRSTGLTSGTGVTLNIGGALATPGNAAVIMTVSGMVAWIKYSASAFTLATSISGAGGPVLLGSGLNLRMEGYDQTRGDRTGNRPLISWAGLSSPASNTYTITTQGSARQITANLSINCNSLANASGINISSGGRMVVIDSVVQNADIGILTSSESAVLRSQVNTATTGFSGNGCYAECDAVSCTTGYSAFETASKSMARSCGTGFSGTSTPAYAERCLADLCTTAGFDLGANTGGELYACIASNNSGVGAIGFKVGTGVVLFDCAVYNNTTHVSGTPQWNEGQITLSADPYVSQGSGDFRPNNNNPGGAQLRGAGIGVFGQTDNVDIGAVQHSDSGGGATYIFQVES